MKPNSLASNWTKGFIWVLPFALFYWLVPFCGNRTIGNDYTTYPIPHQMEAQFSIVHGSFPLYSPGFAGGRSSAALTLGQLHHPIAYLAALSPGYWKGDALEWNTFWRLVSLGLTHLVLFNLLRKLQLRTDAAFVVSLLTVYNQRMLDMFRYGASLENYTGFLLLIGAMTHYYLTPRRVAGPLWMIGAAWLLVCGGHPQIAYLGLLGAALIGAIIPGVIPALQSDHVAASPKAVRFYATIGACVAIGSLLAAAYALPFYFEFIRDAPQRVGRSYEWSLAYSDSWTGALAGFFNPLHSDVHGAFGSSPVILLAVFAPPLLMAARVRRQKILFLLMPAMVLIFLCSVGSDTPVHRWFWRFLPLADAFRTPGRITMLLPPIFMFVLAWVFLEAEKSPADRALPLPPWLLPAQAVVAFGLWGILRPGSNAGEYTPFKIAEYPAGVDTFIFWAGLSSLLLAGVRIVPGRFQRIAGPLLAAVILVQTAVQLRYGTWTTERAPTPTLTEMKEAKRVDLSFRGTPGCGMESKTVIGENTQRWWSAAFARVEASEAADRVAVPRPEELHARTAIPQAGAGKDRVATVYAAFNRVVFRAEVRSPGFLVFPVPYSSQWHAWVDGRESPIRGTDWNGQAVRLPAGDHDVEFRFHSPASVAGVAVSLLTALGVAVFAAARSLSGRRRVAAIIVAALIGAGSFAFWHHSLYHGDDLGMRHVWVSDQAAPLRRSREPPGVCPSEVTHRR